MSDYKRQMAGRKSRINGELFEKKLSNACDYYREKGIAVIEKTPEPMKVIGTYGDRRYGKFIACFLKQAQPDYKGVLCDGTAIIFEAKHTDNDSITRDVITDTQERILNEFQEMNAQCFVMVSVGYENYFRVPWPVFRDMKARYGRKYMNMTELKPYRLQIREFTLLMLEGIALRMDEKSEKQEETLPLVGKRRLIGGKKW